MAHNFCFAPSTAHLRLYRRVYLWDRQVTPEVGRGTAYFGNIRLGMPPFHCQLNVSIQGGKLSRLYANQSGRWIGCYLRPEHKNERFWNIIGACQTMSLARDKVLLRSRQHVPLTAGDGVKAGDGFKAGSYVNRDHV